ncbi:hypothetical protein NFHSH190041_29230 [Shewanella sp. NFH-SH190041]|uniref:TlpA family protein disulfide reductase n=1 Tax=Shewanella sp. NFH-SH190041 TaxID=2950245 RepID=UPI0021C413A7|nr:conjugal transfer protein TraF [Shewanella sp. NFH-SH190041]BDM65471.1 hypothetical protein NFHSH190041_29230 [Shewanella sp. NFH-SH190041]
MLSLSQRLTTVLFAILFGAHGLITPVFAQNQTTATHHHTQDGDNSPQVPLLGYQHQALNGSNNARSSDGTLQHLTGKPTLMMFFEPGCSWCVKQGKALNQLLASCHGQLQAVALGTGADRATLKKTWWQMQLDFPGYQVGREMMQQLGELPATPITLIADQQGQLSGYLRGYVKLSTLKPLLQQRLGLDCNADTLSAKRL